MCEKYINNQLYKYLNVFNKLIIILNVKKAALFREINTQKRRKQSM